MVKHLFFTLYTILTFSIPNTLRGQENSFLHFGVEDGLPSNTVYRIMKDHNGYLWFSTDKGISKFSGVNFKNYNTISGLSDNEIFYTIEDSRNRIWLGTFNGTLSYIKNDTCFSAQQEPYLNVPFQSAIRTIIESADSSITISFENRKVVNIKNKRTQIISTNSPFDVVFKKSDNRYKLFASDGETLIDTNGNQISKTNRDKSYKLAYENNDRPNFFLLSKNNVYDFNYRLLFKSTQNLSGGYDIPIILVTDTSFFLCTKHGLISNNGKIILPDIPITSIIADINGNYWISTLGHGVYVINKKQNEFSVCELKLHNSEKITSQCSRGQSIIITTSADNVYSYNKLTGKVTNTGIQRNDKISAIDGGDYSYYFNEKKNSIITPNGRMISLDWEGQAKWVFHKDRYFYFVFFNGIKVCTINEKSKNADTKAVIEKELLLNDRIHSSAYNDSTQTLWCSTSMGLIEISGKKIVYHKILHGLFLRKFLFYKDCLIGIDDKNDIIQCRQYNSNNSVIKKISNKNVLWENINYISNGRILLSSSNNLGLLTIYTGENKKNSNIQLIENPFLPANPDALSVDSNSIFIFKNDKIIKVNQSLLYKDTVPTPKIVFTNIKTERRTYLPDNLTKIPYSEARNLSLSFDIISFQSKNLEIYYSLGQSNNWQQITTHEIAFPSLNYGDYTVNIVCKTAASGYSQLTSLKFSIGKPFWATLWFLACISLSVIIFIASIVIYLVNRIKAKNKVKYNHLMTYQKLEFRSLNALMNPHFIFNCLNSIQSLINSNNKLAANKYLITFSKLIRLNMHNLEKDKISLTKELDLIKHYLDIEKLRFDGVISYVIEIESDIDTDYIYIPPLLIQPLVENSVKHALIPNLSGNGMLKIQIYKRESVIYIDVIDNGKLKKNVASDKAHFSYGLKNIETRLAYLKQIDGIDIEFSLSAIESTTTENSGTKASIRIKLL